MIKYYLFLFLLLICFSVSITFIKESLLTRYEEFDISVSNLINLVLISEKTSLFELVHTNVKHNNLLTLKRSINNCLKFKLIFFY